jgi:hypothetical protein
MVIVVENEEGEKRRSATRRVENTGTFHSKESMYRIAGLEAGCFRRASPYCKYLLFNLLFERENTNARHARDLEKQFARLPSIRQLLVMPCCVQRSLRATSHNFLIVVFANRAKVMQRMLPRCHVLLDTPMIGL